MTTLGHASRILLLRPNMNITAFNRLPQWSNIRSCQAIENWIKTVPTFVSQKTKIWKPARYERLFSSEFISLPDAFKSYVQSLHLGRSYSASIISRSRVKGVGRVYNQTYECEQQIFHCLSDHTGDILTKIKAKWVSFRRRLLFGLAWVTV